ncbi:MAG: hypothetical protein A2Z96_03890 [Spirochaetes bacterium GWB1_48_6]|nr:MAG: hypothetical protein A2Z96_03890 [Spirochaetes bacterium GWB1_48_6]
MVRRFSWFLILFFGFLGSLAPLYCETSVLTDLTFLTGWEQKVSGDPGLWALSLGRLSFSSEGNPLVKSQLVLDIKASDATVVSLYKAFVKAKLADLRLTLGKTRLSWGDGTMFNAGDVIFGSGEVDFTADELRDNTLWLGSLYWGFGPFSFVEAVVIPPEYPLLAQTVNLFTSPNQMSPPVLADPGTTSGGGRIYYRLWDVKTEGGYLFNGKYGLHKPYLSFQGALGDVNIHLSSSWDLPRDDPLGNSGRDSWEISTGLFYQWELNGGISEEEETQSAPSLLNLRLEALVKPYGSWEKIPSGTQNDYALQLYPEVSWKSDTITVFIRSLVSPFDLSAQSTWALQWAPLQGFRILTSASLQSRETNVNGWSINLGTRVIF